MTPVCVLRSGGDFTPGHVQWLAKQVPGLVCLSDVTVEGVACLPLQTNWPGWWAKMEAYGPAINGDIFLIDLDTVVFELPKVSETTVIPDFYAPQRMGSGFLYVTAADRARVWAEFNKDPAGIMRRCVTRECWGDQGFLQPLLGAAPRFSGVYSYKVHCRNGLPAGAKVVCFHGKPRPWNVKDGWVPRYA